MFRQPALRLGLHQVFGLVPSVDMIVNELAQRDRDIRALLPLKSPLLVQDWNVSPQPWFLPGNSFFTVDNPNWGNNAEASTSSSGRQSRLQLLSSPSLVTDPPTDPRPLLTMGGS
jgi:hypothetical protein